MYTMLVTSEQWTEERIQIFVVDSRPNTLQLYQEKKNRYTYLQLT